MAKYHIDKVTKQLVPGPAPRSGQPSGDGWRYSDRLYSATPWKAPDGTVINSRKAHRDYMARNGLTTADDFTVTWNKAGQEREQFFAGRHDRRERAEAVKMAMDKNAGKWR